MPQNIKKKIRKSRSRSYLAKDFDSFKAELHRYAKIYFPEQIQDFSEASLGGLLLEMAAYVGDSLSFYLDHQFNELFSSTAIENKNILKHIREAGVPVTTASPATVVVNFFVDVFAETNPATGVTKPRLSNLPMIKRDTAVESAGGVKFYLTEDLDFSLTDKAGNLKASQEVLEVTSQYVPIRFRLMLPGVCVSGKLITEAFNIPNNHIPFREILLAQTNVSSVLGVQDDDGNQYYEVDALTQDIVFTQTDVSRDVFDEKLYDLAVTPAPRRFLRIVNPMSKITTLRFGSGNADTLDDDIIPDPSALALPLYGKKTFSRFVIDPNSLLSAQTLGVAPLDTTLSITYLHGGGLSHNISANSINSISTSFLTFPRRLAATEADVIRGSLHVNNPEAAGGGLEAPTLEELKFKVASVRQMQSRIVSAPDLIARVYTLPAKFGRAFRVAVQPNPSNPLAATMFIICKDSEDNLAVAPDVLKMNLSNYLNEFRLISDAIDMVDARVINFGVEFSVIVDIRSNPSMVVQQITSRLNEMLKVDNFQINQPINTSDIVNMIINNEGVVSMASFPKIFSRIGDIDGRKYSTSNFNPLANTVKGLILPPPGGIFELKFPDFDIVGNAS